MTRSLAPFCLAGPPHVVQVSDLYIVPHIPAILSAESMAMQERDEPRMVRRVDPKIGRQLLESAAELDPSLLQRGAQRLIASTHAA